MFKCAIAFVDNTKRVDKAGFSVRADATDSAGQAYCD